MSKAKLAALPTVEVATRMKRYSRNTRAYWRYHFELVVRAMNARLNEGAQ